MTTHTKAPDIPNPAYPKGGYPTKGKRLGPAWDMIWRRLQRSADGWVDGTVVSAQVAEKTDLASGTLVALLSRAAKAGVLERKTMEVAVPMRLGVSGANPNGKVVQSVRPRTFYRIPAPTRSDD